MGYEYEKAEEQAMKESFANQRTKQMSKETTGFYKLCPICKGEENTECYNCDNTGYDDLTIEDLNAAGWVKREKCKWTKEEDPDGCVYYETSCNEAHYFPCGNINENQYRFCPYCGSQIIT